jgi:potassium efflux system protein
LNRNIRLLAIIATLLALAVPAPAAEDAANEINLSLLDNAISQAESNTALSEEQRNALTDSYRRSQGFIKSAQSFRSGGANYAEALENAAAEAVAIQEKLEADSASSDAPVEDPDASLSLAAVQQLIQRDKAELAAQEAKSSDLTNQLEAENGRPGAVRERLAELKKIQEGLANQAKVAADPAEDPLSKTARGWLQSTQVLSVRAETAKLEQELLSQPMRLQRMRAQKDKASAEIKRLQVRVKAYDLYAVKLRQNAAEAALVAAESAQADAEGKHPLILSLAQANLDLSANITDRTSGLESLKSEEADANAQAQSLESDLLSTQRKLEVLGMSQALGRVLSEQKLRLSETGYNYAEASRRDSLVAESSLRQFEYEDERRDLRSLNAYVATLTEGIEPEEVAGLNSDLTELARARRELIARAIEIESTYLRSLGELDFAARRVHKAVEEYRAFISQRLMWIRSSDTVSLDTFKPVPDELEALFAPSGWLALLMSIPQSLLGSPVYPVLLLLVAIILRFRGRLLQSLEDTGRFVGHVKQDSFLYSFQALGFTTILAICFPLLVFTLGLALGAIPTEATLVPATARALRIIAPYYLGLEFLRYLLVPQGLVVKHFQWTRASGEAVAGRLRALSLVFLPALFFAIILSALFRPERESTVSSLLLIVALLAFVRFFAGFPNIMQGQLDRLLQLGRNPRRSMLGSFARYTSILIPCGLILCILLGYTHTAIEFLRLLVLTNALIAGLLLLHDFGIRWLRIVRLRLIDAEREAKRAAAAERAADADAAPEVEDGFREPDPEALGEEGRRLLNVILTVSAIFGIWGTWADVLPALGILDSIELWQTLATVDGVQKSVPVTLGDLFEAIFIGFVGYIAVRRVPSLLGIVLHKQIGLAAGTVYASVTLIRYALMMIAIIMVFGALGAAWGQIQWAVAALSVGIGFGLQEIVANFISGIILLFEQPIRVGDTVTVGETSGVVTRIRMRATTIRDWDGRELLVPNKEFITGRLLNWSLSDKQSRIQIEVGVAYGTDLAQAMRLAMEVAAANEDVLKSPEPFITFDEFGDNALKLVLRCYLGGVDRRLTVSSTVRLAIDKRFNEAGIVVAFPQRDVHLDTSAPLDVNIRNLGDAGLPAE